MNALLPLLIAAISQVESGGNAHAIGARGETGPLQISAVCLADVNRIQKQIEFTRDDTFDPMRAREIFRIYVEHYVTAARLGREPILSDYAICWNSGPKTRRNAMTLLYWDKVKAELNKLGETNL